MQEQHRKEKREERREKSENIRKKAETRKNNEDDKERAKREEMAPTAKRKRVEVASMDHRIKDELPWRLLRMNNRKDRYWISS